MPAVVYLPENQLLMVNMIHKLPFAVWWQIGVFYQKGLNKAGVENRKLHGFGVKSSIWFNKP